MKNKSFNWLFSICAVTLFLAGCAHSKAEKDVDQKVSSQSAATQPGQIAEEAYQIIQSSSDLTADQKTRMSNLLGRTHSENLKVREDLSKLKMVLFKELVSKDYNSQEISILKKKIKKLHTKQLNTMLKALDEAQLILGKGKLDNEKLFKSIAGGLEGSGSHSR